MPTTTRTCCMCRERTTTWEKVTGQTPAARNYYYCSSCAPHYTRQCPYCTRQVRATDTSIFYAPYDVPMTIGPQIPIGHRVRVCHECRPRIDVRCAGCHETLFHHFAPHETVVPMHCNGCKEAECPRCKQPRVGRWQTNAFDVDAPAVCNACRFLAMPETTFNANRSKRLVGFELEFFNLRNGYTMPELVEFGNLHSDGSISPTMVRPEFVGQALAGREFASRPMNGDTLWNGIERVMHLIKDEYVGDVNSSCGLHVHVNMQDYSGPQVTNACRWWMLLEPMFFSLVEQHRRNNRYALPYGWKSREISHNRYMALNYDAWAEHGTLEVRLHHATLDPDELRLWVLLLLAFFDNFPSKTIPVSLYDMSMRGLTAYFMSEAKLPWRIRKEMVKRARKFGWTDAYQPPARSTRSVLDTFSTPFTPPGPTVYQIWSDAIAADRITSISPYNA